MSQPRSGLLKKKNLNNTVIITFGNQTFYQVCNLFSGLRQNLLFQSELHRVLIVSCNHYICFPVVFDLLQHILQTSERTTEGRGVGIQTVSQLSNKRFWTKTQGSLVIHPVSGFIVGVYWIFVAYLLCPGSLLVHVRSSDEFGSKVPAFPPRQLDIQGQVVIGFLNNIDGKNLHILK